MPSKVIVNGLDVLETGSVVAFFGGSVELYCGDGTDRFEVEFTFRIIGKDEEPALNWQLIRPRQTPGPRLQLSFALRGTTGGISSAAPTQIGNYAGHNLHLAVTTQVITKQSVLLSYTFYLGEQDSGEAAST